LYPERKKISTFLDFYLRQHVEALSSFIKDTTDYVQKMAALNPLPSNTTLVTMDVTSLYTNIPHSDGIEARKRIWESRSIKVPPTDCLATMLTIVLKKNNFTFNGEHYLRINGTAIGTKMAPSYANTWAPKWLYLMLIHLCENLINNCSYRLLNDRFLGTDL
jgi:hypothetical protein